MKKSLWTLLSLMLVASVLLAACGTPAATQAPATEPAATTAPTEAPVVTEAPAEPVEVTLWHAYGTGSAEETALGKVLDQAAIDLPNIKINVLQVPFNDIFNKYRTDVAAGVRPRSVRGPEQLPGR